MSHTPQPIIQIHRTSSLLKETTHHIPRPKFKTEFSNFPATTFGKSTRTNPSELHNAAAEARLAYYSDEEFGVERAGTAMSNLRVALKSSHGLSTPVGSLPSTLRSTPGKYTAWGTPVHHVPFKGEVDVSTLIGKRAALQIQETIEHENFWKHKKINSSGKVVDIEEEKGVMEQRGGSSANTSVLGRKKSPQKNKDSRSKKGPKSWEDSSRPRTTAAEKIFGNGVITGGRNLKAKSVDGRAISTFGGAFREIATGPPGDSALAPGPGQYVALREYPKSKQGLLKGGSKYRGNILMTKSGLIGEISMNDPIARKKYGDNTLLAQDQSKLMNGTMSTIRTKTPAALSPRPVTALDATGDMSSYLMEGVTPPGTAGKMNSTVRSSMKNSFLGALSPSPLQADVLPVVFNSSHTFNVQLAKQEDRRRMKILRLGEER